MVAVFLLATYGEGEPTDNCIAFNGFCNTAEAKISNCIPLRYAIFGLGNSFYQFYKEMAKRVASILDRAGAQRLGLVGLGDDGLGTLEADFLSWKDETLPLLAKQLGATERGPEFVPTFNVREHTSDAERFLRDLKKQIRWFEDLW